MPNDIANNMADAINQLEKELKDLREENKELRQEINSLRTAPAMWFNSDLSGLPPVTDKEYE